MTRTQWERVRTLFEHAVESPPADLGVWLAAEAADDADVRAEVASLLDYHMRTGAFLAEPVAAQAADLLGVTPSRFIPGQVVGSYSIIREAGQGGMGRVYVAVDTRLNRTVAIKILSPGVTGGPGGRERLQREARAAAALTHPGICTVHALEEFDGELFIVSEFVDGRTLRDEMSAGRLPGPRAVLDTARELSSALAAAHARGITHRDLKPENVMRTSDGRLKILDFGLARSDGPAGDPLAVRVTQEATTIGTPAYMAPEQLNGLHVDARADVFALGVLLYEYASGVHPFEAPTPLALVSRVMAADPEPVERRVRDLPHTVATVIARCLRKAPEERYGTAGEVLTALGASTATASVQPSAVVPGSEAIRWWRTHQMVAIVLYLLAASLAWQVKEWRPGVTLGLFIAIGIAAAIGGILRGHLIFTEQVNTPALAVERTRTGLMTMFVDLLIAVALVAGGLLVSPARPVAGVVTIALAAGIALTRLLLEPSTTAAAFPPA